MSDEIDIEKYYVKCKEAYKKRPAYLFNMDETFWRKMVICM